MTFRGLAGGFGSGSGAGLALDAVISLMTLGFGVWLVPRTIGVHAGVARRNAALASRVTQLAETRVIAESRENSALGLAELRALVRGIHPPVLADRGLADAIRALALGSPVPVEMDIQLPGHPPAGMHRAGVHRAGMLRIEVTDDGHGGADPANGTGLLGVERRVATFDGILAVSSPPGGPTIIVIEVPCALSSPKTSSS
ncbi:MAG: sensor histidine kinase [Streptosporangiaceae bacterium]